MRRWAAVLATAGWVLALTLFQPLTEVIDDYASPNQYWARDLRWTALLAICGGLVAALHATARSAAAIGGTGVALLTADVVLDRAALRARSPPPCWSRPQARS